MDADLEGLPARIDRYEIRGFLGRGPLGRVLLAHDPKLNREVALKVIEPHKVSGGRLVTLRKSFFREASASAALRHPNIVEIFDYSQPDVPLPFLACEVVDGSTLQDLLEERGGFAARVVVAIATQLISALAHAHARGLVHGNLNPAKMLWTPKGRVCLGDFCISRAFDRTELAGTFAHGELRLYGSPAYVAPERLRGDNADPRTDYYGLGAILYTCLTGEPLIPWGETPAMLEAVATGRHTPVGDLVAAPAAFSTLIEQLLAVETTARPENAETIRLRLDTLMDELDVGEAPSALVDFGAGAAQSHAPLEPSLIDRPEPSSIRIPRAASPWAAALARGPVIIALLAVGIALAAGVYVLRRLSALENVGEVFMPPKPPSDPEVTGERDVYVLLKLGTATTVFVDGAEVGTWDDRVRLALPPGRHRIEGRSAAGTISREVLLLKDTEPVFVLHPKPPAPGK